MIDDYNTNKNNYQLNADKDQMIIDYNIDNKYPSNSLKSN